MTRRPHLLLASGIAFLLVSVTWHLRAQTSAEPAQEHAVTGTVINSVSHEPISRALVKIGELATFTDREGRFKFADVKDQSMVVTAEKPGYFATQTNAGIVGLHRRGQSTTVIFLGNATAEPTIIELAPEAILFGRVTDSSGAPLPAVQVVLSQAVVQAGMKQWQQTNGVATTADGEFRFAKLTAGEYRVGTQFHVESFYGGVDREGYAPARYPEGAGTITLAAGQQKSVDFNLRLEKLYPVTGSLNGKQAGQGASFNVITASGEEIQPLQIMTRGSDTFGLLLPEGSYRIKASQSGGPTSLVASTSVSVNRSAVADVALNFVPMATFPIEVEQESVRTGSSEPEPILPGVVGVSERLQTSANQPRPSLQLVSLNPNVPVQYAAQSVNGKPDGPLAFLAVEPGQYLFTAEEGVPWHVTSATCGSTDLTREPLHVAAGAAGCTMQVVFSDASGSVTVGATQNGKPADAVVYFFPVPNLQTYPPPNLISADNATITENLAAGRYDVLAFDKPVELAYRDPEAMQGYAQYTRSITLAPGENATLQLEVVPSEK